MDFIVVALSSIGAAAAGSLIGGVAAAAAFASRLAFFFGLIADFDCRTSRRPRRQRRPGRLITDRLVRSISGGARYLSDCHLAATVGATPCRFTDRSRSRSRSRSTRYRVDRFTVGSARACRVERPHSIHHGAVHRRCVSAWFRLRGRRVLVCRCWLIRRRCCGVGGAVGCVHRRHCEHNGRLRGSRYERHQWRRRARGDGGRERLSGLARVRGRCSDWQAKCHQRWNGGQLVIAHGWKRAQCGGGVSGAAPRCRCRAGPAQSCWSIACCCAELK